jgi:hypothetical protein
VQDLFDDTDNTVDLNDHSGASETDALGGDDDVVLPDAGLGAAFTGGAGDDTIAGGLQDDVIYGDGLPNGGTGADVYVVNTAQPDNDTAAFATGGDPRFQWVTGDGTPLLYVRNDSGAEATFRFAHNNGTTGDFTVPAGTSFVAVTGIPETGSTTFYDDSDQQIGQGTLNLDRTQVRPELSGAAPLTEGDDVLSGGAGEDALYGHRVATIRCPARPATTPSPAAAATTRW